MHTGPAVRNSLPPHPDCAYCDHVYRIQRPNTFEVCLTRRICFRAHSFVDSSSLYNIFSLPFKVHCMFSLLFPTNEVFALLTAMNFQDVELLLQSIARSFPHLCDSMLMSLLVLSPIAPHNRSPEVRAVLHTCPLVADSLASITMGGARQCAMSIIYHPPCEPISRIPVCSSTRLRRLYTYFHIQY